MKKILNGIEKVCLIVMSILLAAVIAVLFYQVISRYLFSSSSIWIEEFARYGNVWITIILFGVVIRKDENIRVDILDVLLKRKPVFLKVNAFFIKLMELTFSVVLLISILELLPAAKNRIIPGLGFPMYYVYLSFVIGSVLSIIYILEKTILMIINNSSPDQSESEAK